MNSEGATTLPQIFTDNNVTTKILEVIETATRQIAVVSPYIDRVGHVEQALLKAKAKGVRVVIVTRLDGAVIGGSGSKEALAWFKENGITVKAVPSLHAKFYMNESQGVITSMNLLRSSWAGSLELGVSVAGSQHDQLIAYLTGHVMRLVSEPKAGPSVGQASKSARTRSLRPVRQGSNGGGLGQLFKTLFFGNAKYCIRCGKTLSSADAQADKVLCAKDYRSWAQYKNPTFKEKHCTSCGKRAETTFSRPECDDCYFG